MLLEWLPTVATVYPTIVTSFTPGKNEQDPIFREQMHSNPYTSNPVRFEEMLRIHRNYMQHLVGGFTLGWAHAAHESGKSLIQLENLEKIRVLMWIMHGSDDLVVHLETSELFCMLVSYCKLHIYPEARHELFREQPEIVEQLWSNFDYLIKSIED